MAASMRAIRGPVGSAFVVAIAAFVGCADGTVAGTGDDPGGTILPAEETGAPETAAPETDPTPDATAEETTPDAEPLADAAPETTDAAPETAADVAPEAVAPPKGFCESQSGVAFCDDFDTPNALTPGSTKWDFLEPVTPPVLTLSTVQAVSKPNALLADFPGEPTAVGLRFAKTLPKADLTEAEWEFDLRFEALPADIGFFLTDFQFSDDGGVDRFGYRLVVFSNGEGKVNDVRVEHNRHISGAPDVLEPFFPQGTFKDQTWQNVKMNASFRFAGEGSATKDEVRFRLWLDRGATPIFDQTYDGAPRSKITLARIAGLPFLFQKKAGHKLYWDNVAVRTK